LALAKHLACILSLALISASISFGAPKASYRVKATFGERLQDSALRLIADEMVIEGKHGESFAFKFDDITVISYSFSKSPRIGASLGVSLLCIPCAIGVAFSKKRAHWLTVGAEDQGAVSMQLHKNLWHQIAREVDTRAPRAALEMVSEDGVVSQTVKPEAQREAAGLLVVESDPAGADVYIDGNFNGLTPRRKAVQPGEYQIRVAKAGSGEFTETVDVGIGETVEIDALLLP